MTLSTTPMPEPKIEHACRVRLKGGEIIELDMSATRVKHMRRTGGVIQVIGKGGKRLLLPAKYVVEILALAPANS